MIFNLQWAVSLLILLIEKYWLLHILQVWIVMFNNIKYTWLLAINWETQVYEAKRKLTCVCVCVIWFKTEHWKYGYFPYNKDNHHKHLGCEPVSGHWYKEMKRHKVSYLVRHLVSLQNLAKDLVMMHILQMSLKRDTQINKHCGSP